MTRSDRRFNQTPPGSTFRNEIMSDKAMTKFGETRSAETEI
jgi:hypothetical protein